MCPLAFIIHNNFISVLYSFIFLFPYLFYGDTCKWPWNSSSTVSVLTLAKPCWQFRIWHAPSSRRESIWIQRLSSQHLYEWLTVNISRHKTPRAFSAKVLGKQQQTGTMKMPEKCLSFVLKFSIHVTLRNWWSQWLCLCSEVLILNYTLSAGVTLALL